MTRTPLLLATALVLVPVPCTALAIEPERVLELAADPSVPRERVYDLAAESLLPGEGPDTVPGPSPVVAYVARIVTRAGVWTRPGGGRRVGSLQTRAAWGGGRHQVQILGSQRDDLGRPWLKVLLPTRPNGSTGWIRRDFVTLSRTFWSVRVDRPTRTVTLRYRGRVKRRFLAVIGKPSTPTPRGRFAVYEGIAQDDPEAFLGPWALHLTAHSNVLFDYGGGPGRIAIHGRGGESLLDPLGSAASHGCIRIDNANVALLARLLPPGAPVEIR